MEVKFKIKEQNLEILNFAEFEKEIRNSHLDYCKSQITPNEIERLQKVIKEGDIVECSAISWHIDLDNISSGMFRRSISFTKNEYGSYNLYGNDGAVRFSPNQVLFILENGNAIPVSLYLKDFLIARK